MPVTFTPEVQRELETWAPPIGLIQNEKNATLIVDFLKYYGAFFNHANLSAACVALKQKLDWVVEQPMPTEQPSVQPSVQPVRVDHRSREQKLYEAGVYVDGHQSHTEKRLIEADRDKLFQQAAKERNEIRARRQRQSDIEEANSIVVCHVDGRLHHGKTAYARKQALAKLGIS